MKKIILTAALILGFTTYAQAQFLQFGLKGGVNLSNFTGGKMEGFDFNSITSFHGGLVVEMNLIDNFSIQPELLYSTQGSEIEGLGEQIKNELGYISIPVLAKFYLTPGKLSIEAGPQFSFLLDERNDVDMSDAESFDFGLAGGLSYKITKNIFISGRYIAGLTEVNKDAEVKNSNIQASIGFLF